MYRTNAQSRVVEEALRRKNIPYKIFAGHSFYERAEVKDMLAYLKFVANERDEQALLRIINFPARGIGDTTLAKLKELAAARNITLCDAIRGNELESAGIKSATALKMKHFVAAIEQVREKLPYTNAYDIADEVNKRFGILDFIRQDTTLEAQGRAENIEELFNSIKEFVEEGEAEYESIMEEGYDAPIITLDLYLENVSLISDLDANNKEEDKNKVSLMTVHSSKGLEFPYVYIVGMEENLFPSSGLGSSENELEEERRLFYVALTRAEKSVKLSFANSRMKWGSHVNNRPSRFLKEIDKCYISNPLTDFEDEIRTKYTPQFSSRQPSPVQRVAVKAPDPNFVADSPLKIKAGQNIEHDRFGYGVVVSVEGDPANLKAVVDFKIGGRKTLLLKFAKIRIVD